MGDHPFGSFVLSQFPIGLALFLANKQFPILQSGLLVGALSIVVLIVFIIGARKTQLATLIYPFLRQRLGSLGTELSGDFLRQISWVHYCFD